METLEIELEGYESQLKELKSYSENLIMEYNEKVKLQEVLEKARRVFMTDTPRLEVSELSSTRYGVNAASERTENLLFPPFQIQTTDNLDSAPSECHLGAAPTGAIDWNSLVLTTATVYEADSSAKSRSVRLVRYVSP